MKSDSITTPTVPDSIEFCCQAMCLRAEDYRAELATWSFAQKTEFAHLLDHPIIESLVNLYIVLFSPRVRSDAQGLTADQQPNEAGHDRSTGTVTNADS
jgi:hypothetical protein